MDLGLQELLPFRSVSTLRAGFERLFSNSDFFDSCKLLLCIYRLHLLYRINSLISE
jgi:hypothetical protein